MWPGGFLGNARPSGITLKQPLQFLWPCVQSANGCTARPRRLPRRLSVSFVELFSLDKSCDTAGWRAGSLAGWPAGWLAAFPKE